MNTNLTTLNRPVSVPLETFKQSSNNLFEPQLEPAVENKITDSSTLSIIKDPIVKAKALDKIPFATKPLPQGGEIVYLTSAEFQEKFACTYSESLHGNKEELSAYLGSEKLYKALQNVGLSEPRLKDVYYRLNNPLQSTVICDMGEVGYGLFASKDIAPGTVLFMYSGQVEIVGKQSIQDYYACSWLLGIELKDKQFQQLQAKNVNPLISSAKVGNLSRFMQHLPSSLDNELGDIIFTDKNSLDAIATNNVQFCTMIINNTPTLVCWTENGIEKHEQIGFSYGRNYWNFGSREPLYFDKMGAVIPTHSYTYKSNLIRAKRLNLYKQGLRDYEAARYIRAIQTIEGALLTEKTINQFFEQDNAFYANGFFTLAYCYLKLNNIAIATRSFEKAISFFYVLASAVSLSTKQQYQRQLEVGKREYYVCLDLTNISVDNLYKSSVESFKQKDYIVASYKLEYLLSKKGDENFELATTKNRYAYYYSTLSSCYRELGKLEPAITSCESALNLYKEVYPEEHQLVEHTINKLKGIYSLKSENS